MAAVELWARLSWDHTRGTPGIFLSDARRGQRLAAGYDGWFAGVPVRINSLGFRDPREYELAKQHDTFRILVIGDSVTFGHGALFETTYPYLLEQRLTRWRGDVRWQVWNLGVPGYNTSQELAYLNEVGPSFSPDLVVIGFYPNDFTANQDGEDHGRWRLAATSAIGVLQRHLYSFEFYKRAYLTASWQLSAKDEYRQRLEHLQVEADLLRSAGSLVDAPEQRLTAFEQLDAAQVRYFRCEGRPAIDDSLPGELATRLRDNGAKMRPWLRAVRELQRLAQAGTYRVMFFINMAPETCPDPDRFYNGGALADDRALQDVLGQGTPVVSSARAFLHHRPSQMPVAAGHSLGNANVVKANVLFKFLSEQLLPALLAEKLVETQ